MKNLIDEAWIRASCEERREFVAACRGEIRTITGDSDFDFLETMTSEQLAAFIAEGVAGGPMFGTT